MSSYVNIVNAFLYENVPAEGYFNHTISNRPINFPWTPTVRDDFYLWYDVLQRTHSSVYVASYKWKIKLG